MQETGFGGLRVVIVDKNVGEDVRLAETTTDDNGSYRATFTLEDLQKRGKQQPELQACVFAGRKLLGASAVRNNALIVNKIVAAMPNRVTTAPSLYPDLHELAALCLGHAGIADGQGRSHPEQGRERYSHEGARPAGEAERAGGRFRPGG